MSTRTLQIPSERVRVFADREAWLAARPGENYSIGASEVAAILGRSPHRGPWDVWAAKMNDEEIEDEDTAPEVDDDPASEPDPESPLERGQIWEPWIRSLLQRKLDREVIAPGALFGAPAGLVIIRHPTEAWAQSSPDSWVLDDEAVVDAELKSDSSRRGYTWGTSGTATESFELHGVPVMAPHYFLQKSWQLATIGQPYGYIAVLLGSYRMRWFRLIADPTWQGQLLDVVGEWRERHLVRGIEPDPDASVACAAHYRAMYAGQQTGLRAADDAEALLVEAFGEARAEERAAAGRKDGVRGLLLKSMGAVTCLTLPGGRGVRRDKRGALTPYGFDR